MSDKTSEKKKYDILVSLEANNNLVAVYYEDKIVRVMRCSTKLNAGTYYDDEGDCTITEKGVWGDYKKAPYWYELLGGVWGQYCSRIVSKTKGSHGLFFHSVPYYSTSHKNLEVDEFNKLGRDASACVRDAKWVYENCEIGTTVKFVKKLDQKYEPIEVPKIPSDPTDPKYGWDPTDPASGNPYGTKYSELTWQRPYPYIVSEDGTFIDSGYPNLATPPFICKNRIVYDHGTKVTGTANFSGRYPRGTDNHNINGVTFPTESIPIPNCVSYIDCRWQEITGDPSLLETMYGNAKEWYTSPILTNLGYEHSPNVPKLGAIGCFTGGQSGFGHVVVVERILDNGDCYASESSLGCFGWMTTNSNTLRRGVRIVKLVKKGNTYVQPGNTALVFQGFIYLPDDYGGNGGVTVTVKTWDPLYVEPIERTDATIRTVSDLKKNGQLVSNTITGLQAAAINYTPTLNAIYNYNGLGTRYTQQVIDNMFSEHIVSAEYDTTACGSKNRQQDVINWLLNRNLTPAQVAGICGNISQESGYRPWAVEDDWARDMDDPTSYAHRMTSMDTVEQVIDKKKDYPGTWGIGLFGFTYPSIEISMVAYCKENTEFDWYDTVAGQLSYFLDVQLMDNGWKYLDYTSTDSIIKKTYTELMTVPNTLEGAKKACQIILDNYERAGVPASEARLAETEKVFKGIVPYQKKGSRTNVDPNDTVAGGPKINYQQ